jgi:hypothetical protein
MPTVTFAHSCRTCGRRWQDNAQLFIQCTCGASGPWITTFRAQEMFRDRDGFTAEAQLLAWLRS